LDLLADVARQRPQWHIVLVGDSTVDLTAYRSLPNMHFLGRKPYADLPAYCRHFDVGLIPFKINELTKAVNPIKLREYLAAGLPVVSTPLPEAALLRELVHVADTPRVFCSAVVDSLQMERVHRQTLNKSVAADGWSSRLKLIQNAFSAGGQEGVHASGHGSAQMAR